MPKIPFRVVFCQGADDDHAATNLEVHSPFSKGWQSARFCMWPQEVIIQLGNTVRIRKIQLLSHQYKIASKIEIHVGTVALDNLHPVHSDCHYVRLGHVSLSDNLDNDFQSRELKSVHIDSVGRFVKLVIKKNHVNHHNLYNQVGLAAINVIGDHPGVDARNDSGLSATAIDAHANHSFLTSSQRGNSGASSLGGGSSAGGGIKAQSGHINHLGDRPGSGLDLGDAALQEFLPSRGAGAQRRGPGRGDPAMLGLINIPSRLSPLDDIAFDVFQDPETAAMIRRLHADKDLAVEAEDYIRAKTLKEQTAQLHQIGEELGRLAKMKQRAVEQEDFETAARIKTEIDSFREKAYVELGVKDPSDAYLRHQQQTAYRTHNFPKTPPLPPIPSAGTAAADTQRTVMLEEPVAPHPASPPAAATSHQQTSALASAFDDAPLPATAVGRGERWGSAPEDSPLPAAPQADDRPLPRKPSHADPCEARERALPTHRHSNTKWDDEHEEAAATRAPPKPRAKPQPKHEKRKKPEAPPGGSKPSDGPSSRAEQADGALSEEQRHDFAPAVKLFGSSCVARILNADWKTKVEGLEEVQRRLDTAVEKHSAAAVADGLVCVLEEAMLSKIKQVIACAQDVVGTAVRLEGVSHSQALALLKPSLPKILARCGDMAPRVRSSAQDLVAGMAEIECCRASGIYFELLLKRLPPKAPWREAQARLRVLARVAGSLGFVGGGQQWRLEPYMKCVAPSLKHAKKEVRDASIDCAVVAYQACGAKVQGMLKLGERDAQILKTVTEAFAQVQPGGQQKTPAKPKAPQGSSAKKGGRTPRTPRTAADLEPEAESATPPQSRQGAPSGARSPRLAPPKRRGVRQTSQARSRSPSPSPSAGDKDDQMLQIQRLEKQLATLQHESTQGSPPATALKAFEKQCMFCDRQDETFDEEGLDLHYWKSCRMLKQCKYCRQVVEVSRLNWHWLKACPAKDKMKKCKRCGEAIHVEHYSAHVKAKGCLSAPKKGKANRCPLCHMDIPPGEQGWKTHLLTVGRCTRHRRAGSAASTGPVSRAQPALALSTAPSPSPSKIPRRAPRVQRTGFSNTTYKKR